EGEGKGRTGKGGQEDHGWEGNLQGRKRRGGQAGRDWGSSGRRRQPVDGRRKPSAGKIGTADSGRRVWLPPQSFRGTRGKGGDCRIPSPRARRKRAPGRPGAGVEFSRGNEFGRPAGHRA